MTQHQIKQQAVAKAAANKSTWNLIEQEKIKPTRPSYPKTTERPVRGGGGGRPASSSNVYTDSSFHSNPLDVAGYVVGLVARSVGNLVGGIGNMYMPVIQQYYQQLGNHPLRLVPATRQ